MRPTMLKLCAFLLVVHTIPSAAAQDNDLYIQAGKLLDVRSGMLLTDQILIVRNERVVKIAAITDGS